MAWVDRGIGSLTVRYRLLAPTFTCCCPIGQMFLTNSGPDSWLWSGTSLGVTWDKPHLLLGAISAAVQCGALWGVTAALTRSAGLAHHSHWMDPRPGPEPAGEGWPTPAKALTTHHAIPSPRFSGFNRGNLKVKTTNNGKKSETSLSPSLAKGIKKQQQVAEAKVTLCPLT